MVKLDCSAAQLIDHLAFAATTLEEVKNTCELDAGLAGLVDTATDRLWMIAHSLAEPYVTPEPPDRPFVH